MQEANEECVGPADERAGKASSCDGCPNQQLCASGKAKEMMKPDEDIMERMEHIKHKILVLSGKGGVGKSSVACQLAWALSDKGMDVGVLDIDICGPSVPRMTGVEDQEVRRTNLGWTPVYADEHLAVMSVGFMLGSKNDAVIWRGPRKNGLIKQFLTDVNWGELDYLIVDAPPGTSDEHISIAQYLKGTEPDGAIIVTTPQEVALLDVRKEISFCHKVGLPILGVVENMSGFVCPCCSTKSDIFGSGSGSVTSMCDEMKVDYLGAIPLDPQMLISCERGQSFVSFHGDSDTAKAFLEFVNTAMTSTEPLKTTWDQGADLVDLD